jgi:hypothetical protein
MDDKTLQDFFKFNNADLMANHLGGFSANQQKGLQEENKSSSRKKTGC